MAVGTSLCTPRRHYQRSTDRTWDGSSVHSRAQTESATDDVAGERHPSVQRFGNQAAGLAHRGTQNAITPRDVDGAELIQYDVKAWGDYQNAGAGNDPDSMVQVVPLTGSRLEGTPASCIGFRTTVLLVRALQQNPRLTISS